MFKSETVQTDRIEKYVERLREHIAEHPMVALIFGAYVPRTVQHQIQNAFIAQGVALEIIRHTDPRLAVAEGELQTTYEARRMRQQPLPLRVPKPAPARKLPPLVFHANYFSVEHGQLVMSVWDREGTPRIQA